MQRFTFCNLLLKNSVYFSFVGLRWGDGGVTLMKTQCQKLTKTRVLNMVRLSLQS